MYLLLILITQCEGEDYITLSVFLSVFACSISTDSMVEFVTLKKLLCVQYEIIFILKLAIVLKMLSSQL